MNFFKSILSEDPEPPKPDQPNDSDPDSPLKQRRDDSNSTNSDYDGGSADAWSFGGLMKTLAVRSESVIDTYRRDLMEFGDGLKKETEIIRETASRAVKDLPASIEAGASALDGVLKSTADIISNESLGFGSDGEPETPETNRSRNSGRYSWFESQLSAIQSDLNTFCEEPEDVEEYRKWKLGFELEENRDEIDNLIGKNGALEGVYKRVVPSAVDPETFWFRYFYRVDKLKQQESVRAKLVKRAISNDDEEELSWDVDDDDDEDGSGSERSSSPKVKGGDGDGDGDGGNITAIHNPSTVAKLEISKSGSLDDKEGDGEGDKAATIQEPDPVLKQESSKSGSPNEKEVGDVNVDDGKKTITVQPNEKSTPDVSLGDKEVKSEELAEVGRDEKVKNEETMREKNDEKVGAEEKVESVKSVDTSVVHQSKVEEEDLGWDEIEDIGSGDEQKIPTTSHGGSPNRAELRKRLSAAEDDEDDLNWDIEDDDEPVKA